MPKQKAPDALAGRFFREFSRMEYALKVSGFHNGDGPAEANWARFAHAVEQLIVAPPTSELSEAIDFLLREPPKKQIIEAGLIRWREVRPQTNSRADEVFQYIRRVRNNLFHGGKFNGYWFAPQRSEKLLNASLVVIRASVEAEPNVRAAYHG